ncbi:MAG: peptidoglycan DD-metalloendopeptidase family protein [Candidatus Doudnabacteria bacterium]|nr:peptidoglycan DD-metalloendopeptidase family protein [Candidatus Doudnabacteria bacterium]
MLTKNKETNGAHITTIQLVRRSLGGGGSLTSQIKNSFKQNNKFTIHPFKSLHAKTLLPLPFKGYLERFGLELVVLIIAIFAITINLTLSAHADLLESKDNSVIFSYLRSNPNLNIPLLASSDTSTILARADRLVYQASAQSNFSPVILTNAGPTTIQENVIVKTNPADTAGALRQGRAVYEVTNGDTIIGIAASFGVSPETVMLENKLNEISVIKPGQKLTILPTTGISHALKEGETVAGLAKKYNVSEDDILDANDLELAEDVWTGDVLVIPLPRVNLPAAPKPPSQFVKDESNKVALRQAAAPSSFVGGLSFIWPTATRQITQGFNKRHSGIDISDSKMEPIYASEDGFVEISGWQSGYGNAIVLNHGNGFKTRYGHASELYVSAGDQVAKGQVIAKQGRTGRVRGVTGIHLHFEIIKNGARVNPLSYVKP